jgi:hypothetical protein
VALEEGDLLTDRILEQPLWKTWLESSSGGELDSLKRQIDATTELQDALQRRFEAVEPAARADLDVEIKALCRELNRDENAFSAGQVMSDEDYIKALTDIDRQIRQTLKSITQQAIERARLPRLELEPTQ